MIKGGLSVNIKSTGSTINLFFVNKQPLYFIIKTTIYVSTLAKKLFCLNNNLSLT